MTRDIVQPTKTISQYKNELLELINLQAHFINCAKNEIKKGFRFTADQLLSNAEGLKYDIEIIEEMIEKVKVKAPMRLI